MADELTLTNDTAGWAFVEETISWGTGPAGIGLATELSAHGQSGSGIIGVRLAPKNGKIVDFGFGAIPAVSASGFITGTITAQPFINSISAVSTVGFTLKAGSTGQGVRTFNNTSTTSTAFLTPTVLNTASNVFSAGDQIGVRWDCQSLGSAAAGTAGTGLYGYVRVRYTAS